MIAGLEDWLFYYLVFQYVGIAFLAVYLLYNTRFKIANKAVFYRKVRDDVADENLTLGAYSLVENKGKLDVVRDSVSSVFKRSFVWIGEKEFSSVVSGVSFMKREFPVDMSFILYRKFGFTFYGFDVDSKEQLGFGGQTVGCEVDIDKYCQRSVWASITAKLSGLDRTVLILILVAMVAIGVGAFGGGYLVGGMGNHTVYTGVVGVLV